MLTAPRVMVSCLFVADVGLLMHNLQQFALLILS